MSSPIIPSPAEEKILESSSSVLTPEEPEAEVAGRSLSQIAWSRVRRDKPAMVALGFIVFVIAVAAFAPLVTKAVGVTTDQPFGDDLTRVISDESGGLPVGWTPSCAEGMGGFKFSCSGISLEHPFGVEPQTGRDIFAMLVYGSRISLLIATVSTVLVIAIGMVLGTVAGYLGGWFDGVLGRVMDLLLSFPTLLMLLVLTPVFLDRMANAGALSMTGNTARVVYMITFFALFSWPYLARIVRGQVIGLREREFVESARAMGSSSRRIVFKELIPNLWAPILVYASLLLPSFIAFEAALSYLGVGVEPPSTTWGKMLGDSVSYFAVIPWYLFIPGTYLFMVVLAFNIFGDAVRDALDPRAGRV
jgi:peptide/nickel transport system permease protein